MQNSAFMFSQISSAITKTKQVVQQSKSLWTFRQTIEIYYIMNFVCVQTAFFSSKGNN